MNNRRDNTIFAIAFAVYWFFAGYCLTIVAPWPWPRTVGLAGATFALIIFAVFIGFEDKGIKDVLGYGHSSKCLDHTDTFSPRHRETLPLSRRPMLDIEPYGFIKAFIWAYQLRFS